MNIIESEFVKRNFDCINDNTFDARPIWWDAENEEEYNEIQSMITSAVIEKEKYLIRSWCDISGYQYWTKQMEEPNYIQITVVFKDTEFTEEEEKQFIDDFERFYCGFEIYGIF